MDSPNTQSVVKNISIRCKHCKDHVTQPIISTECLHRFCPSCTKNQLNCPYCGAKTSFRVDTNIAHMTSKINYRRSNIGSTAIIDILQNDNADISYLKRNSNNGFNQSDMEQFNHFNGPSTSSIAKGLNIGNLKNNESEPSININGFDKHNQRTKSSAQTEKTIEDWNKSNLVSNRQFLNKRFANYKAIVLWPDGLNYGIRELPQCLLRPRHLYVPIEATVSHLSEYLIRRAEIEASWKHRHKFRIEFMPVEDEREEVHLWVNPLKMRNIEYLATDFKSNLQENVSDEPYVLVVRSSQDESNDFNTNLIMSHPFKPLVEGTTVDILLNGDSNQNKQESTWRGAESEKQQQQKQLARERCHPKLVFRFVYKK